MTLTQIDFFARKILQAGNIQTCQGLNVLVGGNGSGKSSLLESIYSTKISDENYKIVVFTSGQNQNFSEIHIDFLLSLRKDLNEAKNVLPHSFYFDVRWAPLLLTMAVFLKNTEKKGNATSSPIIAKGHCSKFLLDNNYSLEEVVFKMNLPKFYLDILKKNDSFASSDFVQVIDVLLDIDSINQDKVITNKPVQLSTLENSSLPNDFSPVINSNLYSSIEKLIDQFSEGSKIEKVVKLLNFFQIISIESSYVDMGSFTSNLKKSGQTLRYGDLSDGEYQLLSCYALLDIFSDYYDCIILDEVDSHVHVSNLIPLWKSLNETTSTRIITSTHSPISLKYVSPERVISLNAGKPETGLATLSQLQKIFDSHYTSKRTVALSFKNSDTLILIDGIKDWQILQQLFKKAKGALYSNYLDLVKPYPLSSTRENLDNDDDKDKFIKLLENVYTAEFTAEEKNEIALKRIICIKDRDDEKLKGKYSQKDNTGKVKIHLIKEESEIKLSERKKINVTKIFLHRREIENYLLYKNIIEQVTGDDTVIAHDSSREPLTKKDVLQRLQNEESISTLDCKPFISSFIISTDEKAPVQGFNIKKLEEFIHTMPKDQISPYIDLLHDYLVEKLTH